MGTPRRLFQVLNALGVPMSLLVGPQQEQREGTRRAIGSVAGSSCFWKDEGSLEDAEPCLGPLGAPGSFVLLRPLPLI